MTDLADIALEFCRECLGWEHAQIFEEGVLRMGAPGHLSFFDLNVVMDVVRGWCSKTIAHRHGQPRRLGFGLVYGSAKPKYTANVKAGRFIARYSSDDPCHALLAACVEASRKMKGAG